MGNKQEPTIPAVLVTWVVIVVAVVVSRSWRVVVACVAWVGIVEATKHFIRWFSH